MALPAAAVPAAATAAGGFLSSAGGQGLLAGAGGFLSGLTGGTSFAGRKRDARFSRDMARAQIKWQDKRQSVAIQKAVADAKAAGLHPLAALGISTGSGGAAPLPGIAPDYSTETPAGSAIETGLNVAAATARTEISRAHTKAMQMMQVREQALRNDYLESQITNSRAKTAAILANSRQTPIGEKGPGPTEPGQMVFSEHQRAPTGIITSSQAAEDRYWEFGGAAQGLLNLGYDMTAWVLEGTSFAANAMKSQNRYEKYRTQQRKAQTTRKYDTRVDKRSPAYNLNPGVN